MRLVAKKKDGMRLICLCILALVIRWSYVYTTKGVLYQYSYVGSHLHYDIDYSVAKDILSTLVYLVESFVMFKLCRESEFKDNLLYMLYIIYLMPLNAITPLINAGYGFLFLSNLFIMEIIVFLSMHKKTKQDFIKNMASKDDIIFFDKRIRLICFVICVLFIIFKISINGFHFSLQILGSEIYDNRLATVEMISLKATTLIGRITNIISNLATYIAPIYLLVSLKQKKIIEVGVALLAILSQFSLFSMKGNLLLIPVVMAIVFYKGRHSFRKLLFGGCLIGFLAVIVAWRGFAMAQLYFVFIRRIMFVPTWINTMYYDFFSTHSKLYLTDEVFLLRHILPPVYNERILTLISQNYFDGLIVSPNNGMFAEAFMQFGVVGVLIYPIIYKIMFDWIDKVYKNFSSQFKLLICSIISINLPNIGMFRSDFVMSFILMTIVIQIILKYNLKVEVRT